MQNSIDPFKIVPQGLQTSSRLGGQTHVFSISKCSQRDVSEEQIYKVGLVDFSLPQGSDSKALTLRYCLAGFFPFLQDVGHRYRLLETTHVSN